VENLVQLDSAYLAADDSTPGKPYGFHIELVTGHWSAKHQAVVEGINLITCAGQMEISQSLSMGASSTKRVTN
jgi:hypothetical protein